LSFTNFTDISFLSLVLTSLDPESYAGGSITPGRFNQAGKVEG